MSTRIFSDMISKTMLAVYSNKSELIFTDLEGNKYRFYHDQLCCEQVYIEDICGDFNDLCGLPLLQAEVVEEVCDTNEECGGWSFYKFATNKGAVVVRWYGVSNGYYSIEVNYDTVKLEKGMEAQDETNKQL